MWPKALMQLLELAPHVTRLVPMADRYLQSRGEVRDTQRAALDQVADGLRGDLKDLAAAQASVSHQLNAQSETLAGLAADMRAMRIMSDELDARLTRIETRMSKLWMMSLAALIALVIFAAGVIAVFAALHLGKTLHGS
jgi:chromosome segregation ATPase